MMIFEAEQKRVYEIRKQLGEILPLIKTALNLNDVISLTELYMSVSGMSIDLLYLNSAAVFRHYTSLDSTYEVSKRIRRKEEKDLVRSKKSAHKTLDEAEDAVVIELEPMRQEVIATESFYRELMEMDKLLKQISITIALAIKKANNG